VELGIIQSAGVVAETSIYSHRRLKDPVMKATRFFIELRRHRFAVDKDFYLLRRFKRVGVFELNTFDNRLSNPRGYRLNTIPFLT